MGLSLPSSIRKYIFPPILTWSLLLSGLAPLCVSLPIAANAASEDTAWVQEARRLTGESAQVRARSIQKLRAMPRLQQELRGALTGRDRFLALDVVTVLGLKELLPDLVTHIPEDATGYFVHALNTLMDDSSQPDLLKTYLKVLEKSFSDESVLPRTVALIDSLARTRLDLDQKLLKALFRSSQPEVRSSVLGYVRTRIIAWKKESYFDYLGEGLTDRTYQLRLQALLLLQEVPTSWKKKRNADVQRWLKACLQDESQEVRSLCAQVQKRGAA